MCMLRNKCTMNSSNNVIRTEEELNGNRSPWRLMNDIEAYNNYNYLVFCVSCQQKRVYLQRSEFIMVLAVHSFAALFWLL